MPQKSLKDSFLVCLCAFIPIFAYWLLKETIEARPFWAFYDHIETLYYYLAVEINEGVTPHNVDNPGAPVQLAGAILIKLLGTSPENYPLFQQASHTLVLILSFLSSVVMVRMSLGGVSKPLSIVSVWVYFSFLVALMYFQVWSPEAFYYIAGAICVGCLFWLVEQPERIGTRKIFIFGASIGLLISVKFTFLAFLPGLCIVLFLAEIQRGFISALAKPLVGLAGVAVAFIIATFPLREAYPYMFGWVLQNATRDGGYGRGEMALPSVTNALLNWSSFANSSKTWILLMGVLICVTALMAYRRRKVNPTLAQQTLLVLCFVIVSWVFSLLFVMRAYEQRYLLPMGICGVAVYILFARSLKSTGRISDLIIMALAALILFKTMVTDFHTHRTKSSNQINLRAEIDAKIMQHSAKAGVVSPVVIYGWRAPSPAFALRQHARVETHQLRVDKLFPNSGHYTPWPKGQQTFRLPAGHSNWKYAVIRADYVEQLPVQNFAVIDSIHNYKILESSQ